MAQPPGPAGLSTGSGAASRAIRSLLARGTAPRRRADPLAGGISMLAGLFGLAQLFLSWTSIVFSVSLPADGGVSGWQVFQTARSAASLSLTSGVGAYSVLGVAIAGGVMVLLGAAMLTPVNRRSLGVLGLVVSLVATTGAGCWLVRAQSLTNRGLGDVFAYAGPGWYLFLLAGPIGVIGSMKALATG